MAKIDIDWKAVELAYSRMLQLEDEAIDRLPKHIRDQEAQIEALYMTLSMVRIGKPEITFEQRAIDSAELFTPAEVRTARERLASAKAFVAAERKRTN
jgi:hypothetical protein